MGLGWFNNSPIAWAWFNVFMFLFCVFVSIKIFFFIGDSMDKIRRAKDRYFDLTERKVRAIEDLNDTIKDKE